MKTNNLSARVNKTLMISAFITVFLIVASLVGLSYNYYMIQQIEAKAPGIDKYFNPYALEFFTQLLLCISIAISVLLAFKYIGQYRISGIILTILGTLSFSCLIIQGIVISEYYEEYYLGGWNADLELFLVSVTMAINLFFYLYGLWVMISVLRNMKSISRQKEAIINEFAFEATQYVGIVCGIIGTVFAFYAYLYLGYYSQESDPGYINWIYICSLIFVLPYMLVILYWVLRLAFKKDLTLYDEKQQRDLSNAGLITWLLSIPLMSVFMFINIKHNSPVSGLIVFPFYVFTTLLIFSTSVLFNFKRV